MHNNQNIFLQMLDPRMCVPSLSLTVSESWAWETSGLREWAFRWDFVLTHHKIIRTHVKLRQELTGGFAGWEAGFVHGSCRNPTSPASTHHS